MQYAGWSNITIDTTVRQEWPDTPLNYRNYLQVCGKTGRHAFIYLRPTRPAGTANPENKVVHAYCRLTQRGTWTNVGTLTFQMLAAPFQEPYVTWNTAPNVRSEASAKREFGVQGQYDGYQHTFDLAYIFETAANYGWKYYGFRIYTNILYGNTYFHSEYSDKPMVAMHWAWAVEPYAPFNLAPADTVSSTKPRFTASSGGKEVAGIRIQVAENAQFSPSIRDISTVPDYTGGTWPKRIDYRPGSEFAELTSNRTYYWRVNFFSGSGLRSPWSNTVEFRIASKPTITITHVAGDTSSEIEPLLTWDYAGGEGGAQRKYWVTVARFNVAQGKFVPPYFSNSLNKWVDGWGTGIVTSPNTWLQVPPDVLEVGQTYAQIVRVYDSMERDGGAFDPDYAFDRTEWRINPDLTITPVTDLTLTQETPQAIQEHGDAPIVHLEWNKLTTPDRFRVFRKDADFDDTDWRLIDSGPPSDFGAWYGGPAYHMYDLAPGGVNSEYAIHAVVNGKSSSGRTQCPYFAKWPYTNWWQLETVPPAALTLSREKEYGTVGGYYLRANITNGGSHQGHIYLIQPLNAVAIGTTFRAYIRMRSREGSRPVNAVIRMTGAPGTIYGQINETAWGEWRSYTFDATITDDTGVALVVYMGNTTVDLDLDYFYANIGGMVENIQVNTMGYWLMAEEDKNLILPFTKHVETADIEYDELGEPFYHPFGGHFSVVRTPNVAKKITISAYIRAEEGLIKSLEQIIKRNLICSLSSSKGMITRVAVGKNPVMKEVKELHGHRMYEVQLTLYEVGWPK